MQEANQYWTSCKLDNDTATFDEAAIEEALKKCLKPLAEQIGDPDFKEWPAWYNYQGGISK
jgi:hypothetical protein